MHEENSEYGESKYGLNPSRTRCPLCESLFSGQAGTPPPTNGLCGAYANVLEYLRERITDSPSYLMARDRNDINNQKQMALRRLFEDDWLLIHVDTRAEEVTVPDNLKNSPSITFKLSRLFQGSTEITDKLVTAQLLFGSTRHTCTFPYDSIWGATSFKGSNIIWPESAPPEVLAQMEKGATEAPQERAEKKADIEPEKKPAAARGHLRRVK